MWFASEFVISFGAEFGPSSKVNRWGSALKKWLQKPSRKVKPVTLSKSLICLAFSWMAVSVSAVQAGTTVVILRHGEKPAQGLGQLTCQGLNRSLALAPLLLARYGKPVAIYAPNPAVLKEDSGIPYAYVRPLATIEPLAIRAGIPVNVEWGMTQIAPLAARILASPVGTHVVAWEHHWGESLARHLLGQLGGNPGDVPRWEDSDFDSIYVIHASQGQTGTRRVTFHHEHQGLNGLPESCSEGPPRASP